MYFTSTLFLLSLVQFAPQTQNLFLVAVVAVVAAEVAAVESAVKAEAARFDDTGAFRRSVDTGRDRYRGVEDHIVYSDDPAAYSIEFGHSTKSGTHVPGNFVFTNVARRLGR